MNDSVLVEKLNNISIITMNRPEVRNAYNGEMVKAFDAIIDDIEADDTIVCVIVTGIGNKSFCAGADLKEAVINNGESLLSRNGGYQPLQHMKSSKIWIAAVNGWALGGGFELALHCDFIIAAEHAQFGLPEVSHGLLPLGGGIPKLKDILPMPILKEVVLAGRRFTTNEALHWGVINKIVKQEETLSAAITLAESLASKPQNSVQVAHDLLNNIYRMDLESWGKLSAKKLRNM